MIATAAESNPTCFSKTPLTDLETKFVPSYIRVVSIISFGYAQNVINHSLRLSTSTPTGPLRNFVRQHFVGRMRTVLKQTRTLSESESHLPGRTMISRTLWGLGQVKRNSKK